VRASFLSVLGIASLTACASAPPPVASPPTPTTAAHVTPVIAFTDVTVVPMTGGAPIAHATVVVRGERVERVDTTPPPDGAVRIEAHWRYLLPGLADMHVHLPADAPDAEVERFALLSLLNGVTTLRSMQGAPNHLAFREAVKRGDAIAPELVLAGPPLAETLTPDEARARVRAQKAAGYDLVKILGGFDRAAYDAVIDEAHKQGIPVVGHVPAEIGIDAALAAHQLTIEHLMGYGDAAKESPAALDALAVRTRDAHVWNCPTLDYFETIFEEDVAKLEARRGLEYVPAKERATWRDRKAPPADAAERVDRLRRETVALTHAEAGLLVGSDAPGPYIVPGFGYLEELREMAKAGLTPRQIVTAATANAAESLGRDPRDGTVQAGAIADLILVDRDPMTSVENVVDPSVVMVRGVAWTRAELEKRLAITASTADAPAR
jgi:imidazolonepropionase-like amidohydrolase